ncbi:hypothetical protein HMPREF0208_02482 [Citrobacter koseri]|nr:hypothetical protein HMPREF0208_02482 [Citrobacter koseri]
MQLIGIHGDNGVNGGNVLRAAIAEAFGAGFNCADTEGFVGVRFESVTRDMRMIQLNPRHLRQMAKAGAVFLIAKLFGYALHVVSP